MDTAREYLVIEARARAREIYTQRLSDVHDGMVDEDRLARIRKEAEYLRGDFKAFVREAWKVVEPGRSLQWNWHLDVICDHLILCSQRKVRRLIITVPPRSMKSYLVNVFYPVWVWLNEPWHQFNNYSHSQSLAVRDSLRTRRLILSEWFQARWETVFTLARDQQEKANYQNTAGGHRMAFGILSNITGAGGDTQIIDDPHDARSAQSDAERESALSVIDDTLPSRFNDYKTGVWIVVMQRLHEADAAGHLIKKWGKNCVHLCFPMEFEPAHPHVSEIDKRVETGALLWQERWGPVEVAELKHDHTAYAYSGQYQQRPTPDGAGILPRVCWREWTAPELPDCEYVVQLWDTAYEKKEEADYSAMTTWGVFRHPTESRYCVILLSRIRERLSFPELRQRAKQAFEEFDPDRVLIEPKATGKSLIQELRRFGVPAAEWKPERSKATGREVDKTARTHAASIVLHDGCVFYRPKNSRGDTLQWPLDVIEECAAYPRGEHDDLVDTCTMAWLWLRRSWRIELKDDPEDDDPEPKEVKPIYG